MWKIEYEIYRDSMYDIPYDSSKTVDVRILVAVSTGNADYGIIRDMFVEQ